MQSSTPSSSRSSAKRVCTRTHIAPSGSTGRLDEPAPKRARTTYGNNRVNSSPRRPPNTLSGYSDAWKAVLADEDELDVIKGGESEREVAKPGGEAINATVTDAEQGAMGASTSILGRSLRPRTPATPMPLTPSPRKDRLASRSRPDRPATLYSFFPSVGTSIPPTPSANPRKRPRPPANDGMTQMVLDISSRPTTITCPHSYCGMSYVPTVPEDATLHAAHHRRVVTGIEWPVEFDSDVSFASQDGSTAIWTSPEGEAVIAVDLAALAQTGKGKKRLSRVLKRAQDVVKTIDTALGASPLTEAQLVRGAAKLYILVGTGLAGSGAKRVVKAACVVGRIKEAFRVVRSTDLDSLASSLDSSTSSEMSRSPSRAGTVASSAGSDTGCPPSPEAQSSVMSPSAPASPTPPFSLLSYPASPASPKPNIPALSSADPLLRFGEDTTAIYASPTPHSSLMGVHRIYTSPVHRGRGLAGILLSVAAGHFVYGVDLSGGLIGCIEGGESTASEGPRAAAWAKQKERVKKERGAGRVAFSQPTESGRKLARRWTGIEGFSVFVE